MYEQDASSGALFTYMKWVYNEDLKIKIMDLVLLDKGIFIGSHSLKTKRVKLESSSPTRIYKLRIKVLYDSLSHHSVSYFHESGYVSTLHIVDITIGFCTVFHASFVDVLHDALQFSSTSS